MKVIEIKTTKDKILKKYLFDIPKDNCPLCDTPLNNSLISWNIFHGEVNRSCCNSPWQTKDFCPPDGEKETYKEFFNELNKPHIQQLSIPKKLWQPLRDAFKEFGVKDCKNDLVYDSIKHLIK